MLTLVLAANVVADVRRLGRRGPVQLLADRFLVPEAVRDQRGKKAFITTRIGDFGFTIGILLLFWTFQSVDFGTIFKQLVSACRRDVAHRACSPTICLLLFIGAIGKSAQIPLYVWLPDAMEGPTPVSALIHAATMVTAGVYMVARMNPLFSRAPIAMFVVALIGALTAFFAATIGLVQTDIKKVLAYSTVSQLGYMFLGLRRRRLRFRRVPSDDPRVLQRLAVPRGRQRDSRHGRRPGNAATWAACAPRFPSRSGRMFIATFAIAGIPGFAGFFSKDEILEAAGSGPHANIWLCCWADRRGPHVVLHVPADFPHLLRRRRATTSTKCTSTNRRSSMTVPLILLAILSTVGGWFAAPHLIGGTEYFEKFLHPVFAAYAPARLARARAPAAGAVGRPPELRRWNCCTR